MTWKTGFRFRMMRCLEISQGIIEVGGSQTPAHGPDIGSHPGRILDHGQCRLHKQTALRIPQRATLGHKDAYLPCPGWDKTQTLSWKGLHVALDPVRSDPWVGTSAYPPGRTRLVEGQKRPPDVSAQVRGSFLPEIRGDSGKMGLGSFAPRNL